MTGTDRLVTVRDLSVRFGTMRAVDRLSLDLNEGETLAVVGESGSGKSVMLRAMLGLLPAAAAIDGRILMDGVQVSRTEQRKLAAVRGRTAGMVFQDPLGTLDPVAPIGAQVQTTVARLTGLGRGAARARALELLDQVRFSDAKNRYAAYPHELSGGQRQRVGIALALAGSPRVLLADEPTTALDVSVQARILDLLQSLRASSGIAMVLVTHDVGVAARMADRLAVMYAGRFVEQGPADQVLSRPRHPYTRALIASYRGLRRNLHPLPHLPGAPPTHPTHGCAFAPRCPEAMTQCGRDAPPQRERAGTATLCWLEH